jgi:uncharacterized membrane protein YhhN
MRRARAILDAGRAEPILWLAGLIALSYLAAPAFDPAVAAGAAWKAAGIVLLGAFALMNGARLAALALLFSAVGDVALALDPPSWTGGMAAFGLAHLLYFAAFALLIRRDGVARRAAALVAAVLVASAALAFWLAPDMGDLAAPGFAYHLVITAMAAAALASRAPLAARLGAVVFMVSDTLIALGLYKGLPPIPGAIWISYVAAQILLAKGLAGAAPR